MKGLIPRFAYGLVAILIIAAILLTLGQRESNARPSANSYNPSGLHALQELLNRNGIRTRVDRLDDPQLKPSDVVIAAYVETGPRDFGESPLKSIESSLKSHLEAGGRVLVLPFDRDFRANSFSAVKETIPIVDAISGKVLQVNSTPLEHTALSVTQGGVTPGGETFLRFAFEDTLYAAWLKKNRQSSEVFAAYASIGENSGILLRTSDGLFATNRFIDKADNSVLALQLIRGLIPEGGQVVFSEASIDGGIAPSLVHVLGPWATGIWIQLTILFIVIVFTLGFRFGLPAVERRTQKGQREMIDAISDVYLRAKSTGVALDTAYEQADRQIRRNLKLPAHLSSQERDRHLPETIAKLLGQVNMMRQPIVRVDEKGRQHLSYHLTPAQALELIRQLETELNQFFPKSLNRIS